MIYSGCFDATGDYVFYGNGNGYVAKSAAVDGKVVARWPRHDSNVRSVAVCGDKHVSIGIMDDACVMDPQSGEPILKYRVGGPLFRRVAFLSDGRVEMWRGGTRFDVVCCRRPWFAQIGRKLQLGKLSQRQLSTLRRLVT